MIEYPNGLLGFAILNRFHGSALLKAVIPALLSTVLLYVAGSYAPGADFPQDVEKRLLGHPYTIGCFMVAFTFLITFRVNFAYGRYWEGAGNIHTMFSKYLDVGTTMAAFHYQSSMYDSVRPPKFGKEAQSSKAVDAVLQRERVIEYSPQKLKRELQESTTPRLRTSPLHHHHHDHHSATHSNSIFLSKRVVVEPSTSTTPSNSCSSNSNPTIDHFQFDNVVDDQHVSIAIPTTSPSHSKVMTPVNCNNHQRYVYSPHRSDHRDEVMHNTPRIDGGINTRHPSLFLQEASHLISLLMAVSLATLRNQPEGVELPLVQFIPNSNFPPVDPDLLSSVERKQYHNSSRFFTSIMFLLGVSRTEEQRTLYSAARPFAVIGGISDAEMHLLKSARCSSAKVSLCSMWLMEFISREYMAGSTGAVAPPIISRLYQEISNGTLAYQQARKISFVPFPFPHSQLVTFFSLIVICLVPVMAYSFISDMTLACVINFLTILCFVSLHEVSRELENPFLNVPNDLPLTTYQAHFNESLTVTYSGFHPNSYWQLPSQYNHNNNIDMTIQHTRPPHPQVAKL